MPQPVLIAAELRELLAPADLDGLDVTWMTAGEPTPQGDFVAIVPLLSRWVGGTELKAKGTLTNVAQLSASRVSVFERDYGVHPLTFHFQPGAAVPDESPMIGS